MIALTINASSNNVNAQLSPSFTISAYSTLVFTNLMSACAHCAFFWSISTAVLAFVPNSIVPKAYRSGAGISVLFNFFNCSSKSKPACGQLLSFTITTNSNDYCRSAFIIHLLLLFETLLINKPVGHCFQWNAR